MALVTCLECKREISSDAKVCPLCGKKNPTKRPLTFVQWGLWLIASLVGVGMMDKACSSTPSSGDQQRAIAEDLRGIDVIDRGKEMTRAKLKDAESAQFRNVSAHKGKDGVLCACGEVNAKNAFGGYGGFQRFLSAGTADATFIEEQVKSRDFEAVWKRFCG